MSLLSNRTPFKDSSGLQPDDALSSLTKSSQSDVAPSSLATRSQPDARPSSLATCFLPDNDTPFSSATRPQPGVAPSSSAACALSSDAPSSSSTHSQPDITTLIPTLEKKPNTPEALPVELPEIVSPSLQDLNVSFPTPVKVPRVGESEKETEQKDTFIRFSPRKRKKPTTTTPEDHKSKYHCCVFCGELFANVPRHMKAFHIDEARVRDILLINNKTPEEKRTVRNKWGILVNKGDFQHNQNVNKTD